MYSHLRCYLLYVCFVFNGPSPASVRLFSFFSNTNLQKNYHFQRGSNFNSLNRRQAHWPNDHHHGQCLVFLFSCHISNLMAKKLVFFKKNGPIPASFCLFLSFSRYNFNNSNWKKRRWCAWDSNPGPQDGRRRQNHGAMAATQQKKMLPRSSLTRVEFK